MVAYYSYCCLPMTQVFILQLEGDAGCVFGIGFPPFLGGPFRFADQHLQEYCDIVGGCSVYCNLMQQRAKNGAEKFYS